MANNSLATMINTPQPDYGQVLRNIEEMKAAGLQNQLAQAKMQEFQGSQNALRQYFQSGQPGDMAPLLQHPSAIGPALEGQNAMATVKKNAVGQFATSVAPFVGSEDFPDRWSSGLNALYAQGWITPEEHERYLANPSEQSLQELLAKSGGSDALDAYESRKASGQAREAIGASLGDMIEGMPPPAPAQNDGSYEGYFGATHRHEGGKLSSKNPSSSASGPNQFTTRTWNLIADKYPELELTPDGRETSWAQNDRAMQALTLDNANVMATWGWAPTDQNLRVAHFFGTKDGNRFLSAYDSSPNDLAVDHARQAVVDANRNVFYVGGDRRKPRTVRAVQQYLTRGIPRNATTAIDTLVTGRRVGRGVATAAVAAAGGPQVASDEQDELLPGMSFVDTAEAPQDVPAATPASSAGTAGSERVPAPPPVGSVMPARNMRLYAAIMSNPHVSKEVRETAKTLLDAGLKNIESTGRMKEYNAAIAQAVANGIPPEELPSLFGYIDKSDKNLGGTVNIGGKEIELPDPPEGTVWARNADGSPVMEPVEGYPGALRPVAVPVVGSKQDAERKKQEESSIVKSRIGAVNATTGLDEIDRAVKIIDESPMLSTGWGGAIMRVAPDNPAFALKNRLDTIKSIVGIGKLVEMKESSPTGASGFGALQKAELDLLLAAWGSLEQSQNAEDLKYNLKRVQKILVTGLLPTDQMQAEITRMTDEAIQKYGAPKTDDGIPGLTPDEMDAKMGAR